ncbi:DUF4190 domain-containing protein [Nocardioides sp. Kera G14]|uniref:DUF4190 domain-containing protein n=1 Tax=Nocardioides sp. Kera G14 TaxID=2884264 RepID=UPI001D110FBC|nr:DUF4190 domain-containing protein [Nocardioides sp. Kera G14]UDY22446.1 DUF4190 domain-containing protein [Nocardioides sp. Kera G14]
MSYGTPPPPPPPGYGAPQPGFPGQPPGEHPRAGLIFGLGITSLVLGIIGLFCCAFLGLVGIAPWVMGTSALREIDASGGTLSGRDRVKSGRTMGIIGVVLTAVGLVVNIILISTGVIDANLDFESSSS